MWGARSVIFPKAIFEDKSTSDPEDAVPVDDDGAKEAEAKAAKEVAQLEAGTEDQVVAEPAGD